MCKNKKCVKIHSIMQKLLQNFKKLNVYYRKPDNVQQRLCKIAFKIFQSTFVLLQALIKAIKC